MDIGKTLKKLRIEKGLTINNVAMRVGVSNSTIHRWENNDVENMGNTKIEALAKVLGINPLFIVFGEEEYLHPNKQENDLTNTEQELVRLYNQMNIRQQVELLHYAYELLKENDND